MHRRFATAFALMAIVVLLSPPILAQRVGDPPVLLRDSVRIPLGYRDALPLSNDDLYLVHDSPVLSDQLVLARHGSEGRHWQRRLSSVNAVSVHESGASAVVQRVGQSLQLTKLDADARVLWTEPLASTISSSLVAAGPGSIVGYMDGAQYCERDSAGLPPRCVTLPDLGGQFSGARWVDGAGAWVIYRSTPPQGLKVARIPRNGGPPIVSTVAGFDTLGFTLAASVETIWFSAYTNGPPSSSGIVRVSAGGTVAQTSTPLIAQRAAADGDALVAAVLSSDARIERYDANLQLVASAPFGGRLLWIDVGGDRTCVAGMTEQSGGRVVLRCYGPDLQPVSEHLLSDDGDGGFPYGVAVGPDDAAVLWVGRFAPPGGGGPVFRWVVSRVPRQGLLSAPQFVDQVDLPVAVGSANALARSAAGDVAILGRGSVVDGTSLRNSAWATRLSNTGAIVSTYKGPAAQGDTIVAGTIDGADLLGWSQWSPPNVFIGLTPVSTRLHRILPSGAVGNLVELPRPFPVQRRFASTVFPLGARWIVAGTDYYETESLSPRFEAHVYAHDATGTIEWQHRYVGGERSRPYVVPTLSGMVVAHAWRDTVGAPGTPTQCVIESLSPSGSVLWQRTRPARTCGAMAADESGDAVLVTAYAASSSELIVESLSVATGDALGANAIAFASGTAPSAVARVAGGWRVLGRAGSGSTARLELAAFDDTLALDWRRPLEVPPTIGSSAMAGLSGGRVDVAVVSGDRTRSVLSRWRVGADGDATLIERINADTAGFSTLANAQDFAVALVAVDGDTSLAAATLFEPGGNQVVRVALPPDLLYQDSFE
jgi:hypothetical protein